MIKIAERNPAGIAINGKAALARRHSDEVSTTIAPEPQTTTGVLAAFRRANAKEVLRQKQILVAIAIEVADGNSVHGRELGFGGQRPGLEVVAAIEQEHRLERR